MKFNATLPFLAVTLTATLLAPPAHAQRGDRGNQKQPEVWRKMDVPSGDVVPADKALSTFKIAPNFRLELVAAEPLVHDPVAIQWDADGRIWAVEMRGYMPDVDAKNEGADKIGRITVLEDSDGDGKMDKSTVFLDGLQMPRAIAIVEDEPGVKGVLIAEPPILWYCRDTDGDMKCDEKVEAYKGYARQGPVEHTDNGITWCIDNHHYNAKSSKRFRITVKDGKVDIKEDKTQGRGQWGIGQDNYGRLYSNSNSSYLHMDDRAGGGYRVRDQSVYSIRVNPGINRGYQSNMLRDDGRQSRTTGVCGPGVYRGDQYPAEYVGDVFVPEPCANVVTLHDFTEKDGKIDSERRVYDDSKWGKREFLASTDERFRPVNAYTGPDGCMYIVDLYRGILQHKHYVTTFLRKQILERGLDKPIGLGRIYRVVYTGPGAKKPATTRPMLSKLRGKDLVAHLAHANGWHRDTAQRLIVMRGDKSAVSELRKMATSHADHLARLHALWTLVGLDEMDKATAIAAMNDKHEQVVIMGIDAAGSMLDTDAAPEVLAQLKRVTKADGWEVKRRVASTLGNAAGAQRNAADRMLLELLYEHGRDGGVRGAVVSAVSGRELIFLQKAFDHAAMAESNNWNDDVVRDLAKAIYLRRKPGEVAGLLALAGTNAKTSPWRAVNIMDGIAKSSKRPKPIQLDEKPSAMDLLANAGDKNIKKRMDGIEKLIRWKGDAKQPIETGPKLSAEEQKLAAQGKTFYMAVCMACHQLHGEGLTGLAPSLVESDWVTGDKERLIKIALNGLMGPITVNDEEWNLVMPGHRVNPLLTDERLAGVLTYIRNEWGNEASAVSPELVKKVREMTKDRVEPWTVKELNKKK